MRRNFKAVEAFTTGQAVEWLNGSAWLPGVVTGPQDRDSLGYAFYPVRNLKPTRTVDRGLNVRGYAGHLRAAAAA